MSNFSYSPLLLPFSWLYGLGTEIRNFLFDLGLRASHSYNIPIICVGNITVGGTGKTPHTEYLIRLLLGTHRVAVLSRGYKRKTRGFQLANPQSNADELGDEPYQIHQKFPDIRVAVDADRCHGAELLSEIFANENSDKRQPIILLDDAYQHRRLTAGLTILLVDYNRPIYKDHLLPAGRLRECCKRADRADIIIVTKCPRNISPTEQNAIEQHLKPAHWQKVFYSTYSYSKLPENSKILLVTGIANPKPLEDALKELGNDVLSLNWADHHDYTSKDIDTITQKAKGRIILTTEKDAAKLQAFSIGMPPYQTISVEVEILGEKKNDFNKLITDYANKGTW